MRLKHNSVKKRTQRHIPTLVPPIMSELRIAIGSQVLREE